MANKYRGEVQIRLDKTRTLKFGFAAFARFEKIHGKTLQEVRSQAKNEPDTIGFHVIGDMLYAGLAHEDKELTPEEALDLVESADGDTPTEQAKYVISKIFEAVAAAEGPEGAKKAKATVKKATESQPGPRSLEPESSSA